MLHISYEEQRRRLLERLRDPTKYWKYDPDDVDNRAYWPAYQQAYQDAIQRCGTDHAPGMWSRRTGSGTAIGPWRTSSSMP
ncbi:hypothetical protein ACFQZ4_22610 [Catellatospora coxensis]